MRPWRLSRDDEAIGARTPNKKSTPPGGESFVTMAIAPAIKTCARVGAAGVFIHSQGWLANDVRSLERRLGFYVMHKPGVARWR